MRLFLFMLLLAGQGYFLIAACRFFGGKMIVDEL